MNVWYFLANILPIGVLSYRWWNQQTTPFLKIIFWPAFLFKLSCGLLVGWLYQHYLSGGDTFVYQSQAEILSRYASQDPRNYLSFLLTGEYQSVYLYDVMKYREYSNSFFMVLLLHFLNFITGYNYYLNAVYFSLFSFFGCWQLTVIITKIFPVTKVAVALAFLFFPSVVFWSSGVLKESILVGSTAWLLAVVLQLVYLPDKNKVFARSIILLIAVFICFKIRFYFAVAYFPLLAGFALVEMAARQWHLTGKQKLFFYLSALLVLGVGASFLHEAVNLDYFFREVINSYQTSRLATTRQAFIDLPNLKPTFASLIQYAPKAISSAIFRPIIGEINSVEYLLTGLENLLILFLAVISLLSFWKHKPILPITLVISLLIYILLLAALIGFSTANLGSVSRYKVAFLPFLLYLLLQTGANLKIINRLESWVNRLLTIKVN
ncbi:hypothetical protein [Adhaeribacter radiodurans]|uniref:Glycosyltransferase family 39 protein n=1 Tax=Adhaeribacter radiodurans TaxID=2745197 RepID=A0A7L7LB69_9BACT|nr:hypothetical protein [Adhaeribacter radiodurans]QMU30060.1 hypothetical protein HUW48_19415 [Adhaeribacter radiodurans]